MECVPCTPRMQTQMTSEIEMKFGGSDICLKRLRYAMLDYTTESGTNVWKNEGDCG